MISNGGSLWYTIPSMEKIDLAMQKAAVLTEALPYIQDFSGSTVLVKVGGSVMENEANLVSLLSDISFMDAVGMRVVLVHGGGKAISKALKESGLVPQFVDGGDGFSMFRSAKKVENGLATDYLVLAEYAKAFRPAADGTPMLSSANSPLAPLAGYPINYERAGGSGRIVLKGLR